MTLAYAIVQDLVIAAALAWSFAYAARRLAPTASRRVQARIADWIERRGGASRLGRLGARIKPVQRASGGCGSSGCASCGACAAPVRRDEAQPLVFHPRGK